MNVIACSSCGQDHDDVEVTYGYDVSISDGEWMVNTNPTGTFRCPVTDNLVWVKKTE